MANGQDELNKWHNQTCGNMNLYTSAGTTIPAIVYTASTLK